MFESSDVAGLNWVLSSTRFKFQLTEATEGIDVVRFLTVGQQSENTPIVPCPLPLAEAEVFLRARPSGQ